MAERSVADLDKYLRDKGRNPRFEDWQFCQVVAALKILFIEMVKTEWARRSGTMRRHHIHENGLQKHIKKAAEQAGVVKRVTEIRL